MRRLIAIIVCVILTTVSIYADGSGNIDGGGGSMGNALKGYSWSGQDGLRITIVRSSDQMPVTKPIDVSNYRPTVDIAFNQKSKMDYRRGGTISLSSSGYVSYRFDKPLPRIISTDGKVNIDAIKRYMCADYAASTVADILGVKKSTLINGKYKMLIEPIAYFSYAGNRYAMTATEAAIYDDLAKGDLRRHMPSLTHKNLPLSLFLERADLGFSPWTGSTKNKVSNVQIKNYLGLGIVSYATVETPTTASYDYEYRTDTDVITSVRIRANADTTPSNPGVVHFVTSTGKTASMTLTMPAGADQLAWIKWHTPNNPSMESIRVTLSGPISLADGSGGANITAKIVDLSESVPPNPTVHDKKPSGYAIPSTIPYKTATSSLTWHRWTYKWVEDVVWHSKWEKDPKTGKMVDNGEYVDDGHYEYEKINYYANLIKTSLKVQADDKNPTARGKVMKSGYGINCIVNGDLTSNADIGSITGIQNVLTYYPEFGYNDYWRLMERTSGNYDNTYELKNNKYSTYNRRVHFTPLWYPDGEYRVYAYVMDAWTPAGMLSSNETDYMTIYGNVYDDWHIGPVLPK